MKKTLLLLLTCICVGFGHAQLRLPRLISDHMVLQRDAEVKIWGWATPGERVTVAFQESTYITKVDHEGKWRVSLFDIKTGGPYTMMVATRQDTIRLTNLLVGDVWVCSGQSNMETTMERVSPLYPQEIAEANRPYIRYYEVPKRFDFTTTHDDLPGGRWQECTTQTIRGFSAVSYFFADALYRQYQVPIGLINSALGGSPAEAWMSEEALKPFPHYMETLQQYKQEGYVDSIRNADQKRSSDWYAKQGQNDLGYAKGWKKANFNDRDWAEMTIPGFWADTPTGRVNGVMWFRKQVELPAHWAGQAASLLLGRIVDADSVFVNDTFVGTTSYQYPPRRYQVPAGVLKAGKNTIVIRIINSSGRGGFVPDKEYTLSVGSETLDLTQGPWKYKLGTEMPPLAPETFIRWKPGGLYKAMVAPLLQTSIKGVIWYQGESNTSRAVEYRSLFPALINNWREDWNQGNFPFLCVQLANYMEAQPNPAPSEWAMLREAQAQATRLPNTALAVTIDIGEWNDIHPLNKKDVGERLALAARRLAYGEDDLVHSGPVYDRMEKQGKEVVIHFVHVGDGLVAKGGAPQAFAIAGSDGAFRWAQARIENNRIVLWHDDIPEPVAVRYAWADNPAANLYNSAGLPAVPFRTDDWEE